MAKGSEKDPVLTWGHLTIIRGFSSLQSSLHTYLLLPPAASDTRGLLFHDILCRRHALRQNLPKGTLGRKASWCVGVWLWRDLFLSKRFRKRCLLLNSWPKLICLPHSEACIVWALLCVSRSLCPVSHKPPWLHYCGYSKLPTNLPISSIYTYTLTSFESQVQPSADLHLLFEGEPSAGEMNPGPCLCQADIQSWVMACSRPFILSYLFNHIPCVHTCVLRCMREYQKRAYRSWFSLLSCGFQGLNPRGQVCRWASWPTEPSCQPLSTLFWDKVLLSHPGRPWIHSVAQAGLSQSLL